MQDRTMEPLMSTSLKLEYTSPQNRLNEAASAYGAAGRNYLSYADGEAHRLSDFSERTRRLQNGIVNRFAVTLEPEL